MAVIFNQPVKHERIELFPGVPLAFADKNAEPYFIALGWAEATKEKAQRTFSEAEVSVDPEAINATTGRKVLEG